MTKCRDEGIVTDASDADAYEKFADVCRQGLHGGRRYTAGGRAGIAAESSGDDESDMGDDNDPSEDDSVGRGPTMEELEGEDPPVVDDNDVVEVDGYDG